ncbi:DUF1592 domain-containing protein [Roseiconus lacunae]|uniref:DUF1592 domain-containing protein n=1 Tax=Roseiconus lacunae TaxID=2605694 RepID=UPI00308B45DE|nr:DUF1592 domain-containing protein [Stieleria sp. HD01]
MRRHVIALTTFLAFYLCCLPVIADDDQNVAQEGIDVEQFLRDYCIDCHDSDNAEGERSFDTFALPLDSVSGLITANEIIDQITLKAMPPEDADQPSDDRRLAVVGQLREAVMRSKQSFQSKGGRTVMRRLSKREYENTLADLFGRRVDTLGLTADFPKDATSRHLDTIGESKVTSGFLLDQYFQAANRLVEHRLGKPQTEPRVWHFKDNFRQYEELTGAHKSVFKFEFLCLYEQPNTDTRQGGYAHIEDFLKGVPVSGLYDIEVHAAAMHRDTHYDADIFRIDFSEPFQLAVVPGDARKGHIHYPQAIEPILGQDIVPDNDPEWLTFRVWLEKGQTPRFIFPNGPYESRASVIEVNRRYKDEFEGKNYRSGVVRTHILLHGELPHIKIGEVKVHGPLKEQGGSAEEIAVFGKDGFQKEKAAEQLHAFARRAFRRPLVAADRDRIDAMYQRRLTEQATPRQAALDTLKLILCSPSFLYLSEQTDDDVIVLPSVDLASRLSYTLWAGPPDDALLKIGESGELAKKNVLRQQIREMLKDDRTSRFVEGFLDSWLNLRDLGNLPPPRRDARDYYAKNLPRSMKREARLYFKHLLDSNGAVTELLDSDYTFVDKHLAAFYGLPEKDSMRLADGFQRVEFKGEAKRGGVLGMAAVLTVSANGVDTSPVTRGVWVSENILGIVPPPPPDDVPAIDANVSGAETIREKLTLHRADPACNVCHRKIDPLGYALEAFDPIGRYRTKYPKVRGKSAKIDTTGELLTGERYSDVTSFKQLLLSTQRDRFLHHLVETFLSYATGRHMEPTDQFEIEEIVARLQDQGYGLQDLVVESLSSEIFRSP